MKVSFAQIVICLLPLAALSQNSYVDNNLVQLKSNLPSINSSITLNKPNNSFTKSIMSEEIWADDFSSPSTWIVGHDESTCSLDWNIGTGLSNGGNFSIDNIYSTTFANGFAMVDSDLYGQENGGTDMENSWFTNSIAIDLSDISNAILEFESYYYKWSNEQCFVVISTNNNDWPSLNPDFDANSNPNVFLVWPGMEVQDLVNNPTKIQMDISEVAGNQSTVWIRFNWTGVYGYSWFVDDVKIFKQAANDMRMVYGFSTFINSGIKYSRIPSSQYNNQLYFFSLSNNAGFEQQSDIQITLNFKDDNV
jgi:hypothetical protein